MTRLWTFDTQEKLNSFVNVLKEHEIAFEIQSRRTGAVNAEGVTVAVAEEDYEDARRLLKRHKKSRTSRDNR